MGRVRRVKTRIENSLDRVLKRGKELGRQEAMSEYVPKLQRVEDELENMRQARNEVIRKGIEAETRSREASDRVSGQRLNEIVRLKEKIATLQVKTDSPTLDLLELVGGEGANPIEPQMEEFKATNSHTGGVKIHYSGELEIGPDIVLNVKNTGIPEERYQLLARTVQQALECVLKLKLGTVITDPVVYRGDVGVFVKNGSAKDAAILAAALVDKRKKDKDGEGLYEGMMLGL